MNDELAPLISLKDQTALVTGGSRNIGRAISVLLSKAGAFVVINYRQGEAAANETLEQVRKNGGDGMTLPFDTGSSEAVDENVAGLTKERNIDILVNNAGVARDGLIGRMKDSDWDDVLLTNLKGYFNLCRSVSKHMIRRRGGRIINIASTAGEMGNAGQVNYSSSKAGVIGLTKALARELAPRKILVNAVAPGIIAGGMTEDLSEQQVDAIKTHVPLRRMGSGDEVASAVLFLASKMSEYITGQVIRVNGGLYM